MKIKELLGMVAVDANANDIGKIIDVDFDPDTGKLEKITISLKKNLLSNEVFDLDFDDVRSIGDYVLLDAEVNIDDSSVDDEDDFEVDVMGKVEN